MEEHVRNQSWQLVFLPCLHLHRAACLCFESLIAFYS